MLNNTELQHRLQLIYHADTFRRTVGTTEIVIHCHHYNARIQVKSMANRFYFQPLRPFSPIV